MDDHLPMLRLFLRRRSILWLLPIILLPLSALLVMQYRFLRNLEATTAEAERNRMRSALEEIVRDVERYYQTAANETFEIDATMLDSEESVTDHFCKHRIAGAKTYFTLRFGEGGRDIIVDRCLLGKSLSPSERQ